MPTHRPHPVRAGGAEVRRGRQVLGPSVGLHLGEDLTRAQRQRRRVVVQRDEVGEALDDPGLGRVPTAVVNRWVASWLRTTWAARRSIVANTAGLSTITVAAGGAVAAVELGGDGGDLADVGDLAADQLGHLRPGCAATTTTSVPDACGTTSRRRARASAAMASTGCSASPPSTAHHHQRRPAAGP